MSNTLSTMKILQQQLHAPTNLCPYCGMVLEAIHNLYQCNHEVSRGRSTESEDTLQKWLEKKIGPQHHYYFHWRNPIHLRRSK